MGSSTLAGYVVSQVYSRRRVNSFRLCFQYTFPNRQHRLYIIQHGAIPSAQCAGTIPRPSQIRNISTSRSRPHHAGNFSTTYIRLCRATTTAKYPDVGRERAIRSVSRALEGVCVGHMGQLQGYENTSRTRWLVHGLKHLIMYIQLFPASRRSPTRRHSSYVSFPSSPSPHKNTLRPQNPTSAIPPSAPAWICKARSTLNISSRKPSTTTSSPPRSIQRPKPSSSAQSPPFVTWPRAACVP